MKCDLGESNEAPCRRCQTNGHDCVLEKGPATIRVRPERAENQYVVLNESQNKLPSDPFASRRIGKLETQMTDMQRTLSELTSFLKSQSNTARQPGWVD